MDENEISKKIIGAAIEVKWFKRIKFGNKGRFYNAEHAKDAEEKRRDEKKFKTDRKA